MLHIFLLNQEHPTTAMPKSSSSTTAHTKVSSSDPSDPLHLKLRDAQADYLDLIKTKLRHTV